MIVLKDRRTIMEKYPMTIKGYEQLKKELQKLTTVDRQHVIKAIEEARAHGDLKENAEYHAAKEQQGFIEGRIQEINAKLANCNVIDPSTLSGERVIFGATVTVFDLDTEEEATYQIVGEDEVDTKSGKISFSSPIAKGLIGKNIGDEITIQIPKGLRRFEIVEVIFI